MNDNINFWCFIVLCLIGGFIGLQEFYRGKIGLGVFAVLFFWTGIPAIVAFIEAVVWLFRGEDEFNKEFECKDLEKFQDILKNKKMGKRDKKNNIVKIFNV